MDNKQFNNFFTETFDKEFGDYLSIFGFKRTEKIADKDGGHLTFENGDREVNIYSSTHPLDYPHFWNIIFRLHDGEVKNSDYDKVPLWAIKRELIPGSNPQEYSLADNGTMGLITTERLKWTLKVGLTDLEKYHAGFLTGELEEFQRIRKLRLEKASR
jgi:hypothetical protein